MINRFTQIAIWGLFLTSTTGWSAPPDAGLLLREELQRERVFSPVMPPRPEVVEPVSVVKSTDLGLRVTDFHIVGVTAIPEGETQAFLAPFVGQLLTLNELHRVASMFEQWLKGRGLFAAKAYIPPQEVKGGSLEIRVVEGRVEGIDVKRGPEMRLSEDAIQKVMENALPFGSPLLQQPLERGLLLLNDLPAINARAVLAPGQEVGGSRLSIEAMQNSTVSGSVELDNTGNRYTGDWRLGGGLSLNDPYGIGDQWSLRGIVSEGMTLARVGYIAPLGVDGWKIGGSLINSRYRLCCDAALTDLDSAGQANAVSALLSYPLLRSRLKNLTVSANLAGRSFTNQSLGVITSDRKSRSLTLGLAGDFSSTTDQGTYTNYGIQWTSGNLDLGGWVPDLTQDEETARTQGTFDKLSAQGSHLVRITSGAAIYAGFSGQWAGKNLDSSEKFSLGGSQGVRAYPVGEANGDNGWLTSLEWRQELSQDWRMSLFADHGEVTLHREVWSGWNALAPNTPNRYGLTGVGASVAWVPIPGSQVTTVLASRISNNPAHDPAGNDSDGRGTSPRLWIQGVLTF